MRPIPVRGRCASPSLVTGLSLKGCSSWSGLCRSSDSGYCSIDGEYISTSLDSGDESGTVLLESSDVEALPGAGESSDTEESGIVLLPLGDGGCSSVQRVAGSGSGHSFPCALLMNGERGDAAGMSSGRGARRFIRVG